MTLQEILNNNTITQRVCVTMASDIKKNYADQIVYVQAMNLEDFYIHKGELSLTSLMNLLSPLYKAALNRQILQQKISFEMLLQTINEHERILSDKDTAAASAILKYLDTAFIYRELFIYIMQHNTQYYNRFNSYKEAHPTDFQFAKLKEHFNTQLKEQFNTQLTETLQSLDETVQGLDDRYNLELAQLKARNDLLEQKLIRAQYDADDQFTLGLILGHGPRC
jgi:hypothetical protein